MYATRTTLRNKQKIYICAWAGIRGTNIPTIQKFEVFSYSFYLAFDYISKNILLIMNSFQTIKDSFKPK